MQQFEESTYQKARRRVKSVKGFYDHLFAYIVINIMIVFFRKYIIDFVNNKTGNVNEGFIEWLDWNILLTPAIWGIGLLIHALFVFKIKGNAIKNWEERKIQEYMQQEEQSTTWE